MDGTPDDYLAFSYKISINSDTGLPEADTLISIDADQDGLAEQSILLKGVQYSQSDLKDLVAGGHIFLGGPVYPNRVSIALSSTSITEGGSSTVVQLSRSGTTGIEQTFQLGFSGSAKEGQDFTISGLDGSDSTRSFTFAEGESTTEFTISSLQDIWAEDESLTMKVYRHPAITDYSADSATLTIGDAPAVTIKPIVEFAQRTGQVPGYIQISRAGDLSQPLTLDLQITGDAVQAATMNHSVPFSPFRLAARRQ